MIGAMYFTGDLFIYFKNKATNNVQAFKFFVSYLGSIQMLIELFCEVGSAYCKRKYSIVF